MKKKVQILQNQKQNNKEIHCKIKIYKRSRMSYNVSRKNTFANYD